MLSPFCIFFFLSFFFFFFFAEEENLQIRQRNDTMHEILTRKFISIGYDKQYIWKLRHNGIDDTVIWRIFQ